MLAPKLASYDWKMILILTFAGLCITGSANVINQAVEKDTDAQMKRTANRPVASGRMSQQHAYLFALITGVVGVAMMWYYFNLSSALVSAFSLFLYAFIYTPLKKVNSIAVLVGAFPGALPCLIGWVAGNDDFSFAGWSLFLVQFLWQFPHFWAISWLGHQDYIKAGFKITPSLGDLPTKTTGFQAFVYALFLLPVCWLCQRFNVSGYLSFYVFLISSLLYVCLS